jgi:putative DNA primase/helicase
MSDKQIPELDALDKLVGPPARASNGNGSTPEFGPEIKAAAKLSPVEYDHQREAIANKLGVRVSTLDKIVRKQTQAEDNTMELPHWKIEPWQEPVETAALLGGIKSTFDRYIVLPKGTADAIALWVLHAWTFDAGEVSPFLVFVSPTKRCGKTSALIVLLYLTPRSELASNVSPSAVFRYVEETRPTLLIDEADSFVSENEEMRGILDSGHTRAAACVIRNVEVNGEHKPRRFSTWAPKAIATIRALADTLADRAIVVQLQRKPQGAKIARLRRRDSDEFAALRSRAARWAADNFDKLADPDPAIPEVLNDRAADNWRPLFAIADLAGGPWPERARNAACVLSGEERDTSDNVRLLADIHAAFGDAEVIRSVDLVAKLSADPEKPWAEWRRGKPLSQKQLGALLRPFGITSETVSVPGLNDAKGYRRGRFDEAWKAYLPTGSEASKRRNADGTGTTRDFQSVAEPSGDGSKNANLSHSHAGSDASTFRKSESDAKANLTAGSKPEAAPSAAPSAAFPPRLCDHCGGAIGLLNAWNWPGRPGGILLHPNCEEAWYDRETGRGAPQANGSGR